VGSNDDAGDTFADGCTRVLSFTSHPPRRIRRPCIPDHRSRDEPGARRPAALRICSPDKPRGSLVDAAGCMRLGVSATSRGLFIHRPTRDPFASAPRAWAAEPASGIHRWRKAVWVVRSRAANLMIRTKIVIFHGAAAGRPAQRSHWSAALDSDGGEQGAKRNLNSVC